MKQRLLFFLIAVFAMSTVAWADINGTCGENVTYHYNGSTHTLTISGTGPMADYSNENPAFSSIPDSVIYDSITKVVVEEGVTTIGNSAFTGLYQLVEVTLPSTLETIGDYAFFDDDELTTITIPDGVTSIGIQAFCDCDELSAITLSSKLKSIGDLAFYLTSLGSVDIPASVTSIGECAFLNAGLETINVDSNNANYESIDGVLFDKGHTKLIQYPELSDATTYMVPEGVETIGCNAFDSSQLNSIVLSSSVSAFEASAFANCTKLESINIPDNLTEIAPRVFESCKSLTSIVIPDGVTSIGEYAFTSCEKLESVIIPSSVKTIDECAFSGNKALKSLFLPEGVTTLGKNAFGSCYKLKTITIPSTMTRIDLYAFFCCDAVTDVYCCADPDKLDYHDKFGSAFQNNKATKCHVYADKLATYQEKFPDAKVTFVGDLQTISPRKNGDYFWTTFYSGTTGYQIYDDVNADAYTATVEASAIKLHKLGKVIPAGTAVVIAGKRNSVNMIIDNDAEAENVVDNDLKGVDVDTSMESLGKGTFYVLGNTKEGFGFHQYTGKTMAAKKAYLCLDGANARSLTMMFDDETTALTLVNSEERTVNSDVWYTLDGRKLQGEPTTTGIYIYNGRKIIK